MLEAVLDSEPIPERRRQQAGAGRRADQRERREVKRHDPGAGALADRDRERAVLHGRIEGLLERPREPVDLIDEEHRAGLERGEKRGHVALALQRRSGRLHERDVELRGDDLRERGLAEPRRAGEQHVVQRLAAGCGGGDRHRELILQPLLTDEVLQAARPQTAVKLVLGQLLGVLDAG